MIERTTWWYMERFNLPCPGAIIRVKSHLDTYVTIGGIYRIGWSPRSTTVDISNVARNSGTFCNKMNFERCEWEYVYENPNEKQWPRAEYKGYHA